VKNQIKTLLLLGVLSVFLIGIGAMVGRGAMIAMTLFAFAMNLGAYFFSDRIVLRMHRAREVAEHEAPRLHAIVTELSARAGIPKPRVCLIAGDQPNAFATGRNPENGVVAVTEGILRLLTERELRGVIAHELAHIRNRDILLSTIAAGVAAAVSMIANVIQWSAIFGGAASDDDAPSPVAALALAFVAPIAATLVQLGISRSREYLADETGARISGDPEALASALEKLEAAAGVIPAAASAPATASLFIVNPFTGAGGIVRLFSTHPSTRERVLRLRALSVFPGRLAA
jgi:heat shock protein HtpX